MSLPDALQGGDPSVPLRCLGLAGWFVCRVDSKELGGGAMLLVFENTTHDSYNDVLALFSTRLGWFLRRVRSPSESISLTACTPGCELIM